jgi:hypothetical protein
MTHSRIAMMLVAFGGTLALAVTGADAQTFYSVSGTMSLNAGNTVARFIGPRTGTAQGTGTAPVNISVPTSLFGNSGATFHVFPAYPSVAQWVDTHTTSHDAFGVAAGAGPGSFAFCPPVGNPANPVCTNPGNATAGFNGLIHYTAGPNQFGGTMRLILKQAGSVSRLIATGPSQFSHTPRTLTSTFPPGGAASNTRIEIPQAGVITQSPVLGPSGSIQTPGIYVGPGPTPASGFETGQPLTTGQIVLQDSRPSPFTLTLSGYDNRTAAGVGTIQLVGGSYAQRPLGNPSNSFPRQTVLKLTLPEPISALGLGAGALALIALARRRRHAH